jgi:hypothetical protein
VGRKGDVARAIFYMDVRYEGGTHGVTHAAEPDLIVTDNQALIVSLSDGVGYMGLLSVLVQWNAADPPDARERSRNDVVYGFQGNRNPFIDHPEWVNALFVPSTGPTITAITDVPADQGGQLEVAWQRNSLDVAGSIAPIAHYVIQRLEGSWVDVAVQAATQSATYTRVVATSDIASPSVPQPWSQYRVVAAETGGWQRPSGSVSAYSIDNLAPPAPVVTLDASGVPWVVAWSDPGISDLDEACVYRGDAAGFVPGVPLACVGGTSWDEYDLQTHYYRVQFADTHGNLSPWSAEVGFDPTDVAAAPAWRTAIVGIYPNPFNPMARVACALAEPGPARLDLFTVDGRFVRTLLHERRAAGAFEILWDGTDGRGVRMAAGAYLLRLQSGAVVDTDKVLLVK